MLSNHFKVKGSREQAFQNRNIKIGVSDIIFKFSFEGTPKQEEEKHIAYAACLIVLNEFLICQRDSRQFVRFRVLTTE